MTMFEAREPGTIADHTACPNASINFLHCHFVIVCAVGKVTPLRLCDGSHSFALALKCKTLGTLRLFIILGRYCVCVNSVCWPCFVGQCLANISLVSGLLRQLLVSDAAFDRAVVVPTLFENPQIK